MKFIWVCLLTLQICASSSALAGPVCPPSPIRLAYFEFGFFYKVELGVPGGKGIDIDIVDELSKRSGCKFDARVQSRARTWIELKAGRLDMTVAGLRTVEREEFFWLFPYVQLHHQVLLGPGAPREMAKLEDFQAAPALKFGVVRGFKHSIFYDPLIDQWMRDGRVIEFVDEALLIGALTRGEVAAMLSYPVVYRSYLNANTLHKSIRITDWDPENTRVNGNLVLNKAAFTKQEADKWGSLLREMKRDGTLARIYRKYVNGSEAAMMTNY